MPDVAYHGNQRSTDSAQPVRLKQQSTNSRGEAMCEERAKPRCFQCELVQWADNARCRRCGQTLVPVVNVVERVVERVVFRQDSQCIQNLGSLETDLRHGGATGTIDCPAEAAGAPEFAFDRRNVSNAR